MKPMVERFQKQIADDLRPGEVAEIGSQTMSAGAQRQAMGTAAGGIIGGAIARSVSKRADDDSMAPPFKQVAQGFVLRTDQRLVFMGASVMLNRPKGLIAEYPIADVEEVRYEDAKFMMMNVGQITFRIKGIDPFQLLVPTVAVAEARKFVETFR